MNRTPPDRPVRRPLGRPWAVVLALVAGGVPTLVLAAPPVQADPPPRRPEVVVELRAGVAAATVAARNGAEVVDALDALPGTYLLRAVDGRAADLLEASLGLDPDVVEADVNGPISSPETVNGTIRFYGWAAQPPATAGDQAATALLGLGGLGTTRGAGQTVAVLDTGVQLLPAPHPALAGALAPGIDLVDGDRVPDDARTGAVDPLTGVVDGMAGHGTHVAAIVRLVAPEATILPVRVLDPTGEASMWTVTKGLLWAADHGATVVNASLGGRGSAGLLKRAVDTLEERGVVVVAAAGNDGRERDNFPAAAGCAVSVAASDAADVLAPFTTTGDRVTVAAPGVDVTSAHPFSPTGYASWSGSSMATPFVAGTAALVRSVRPDLGAAAVQTVLFRSAKRIGVSADAGGFGRLDPVAAVAAARQVVGAGTGECRS